MDSSTSLWSNILTSILQHGVDSINQTRSANNHPSVATTLETASTDELQNSNSITPPSSRMQYRQLDIISSIADDYNRNFRQYQERMSEVFHLLENAQNMHRQIEPIHSPHLGQIPQRERHYIPPPRNYNSTTATHTYYTTHATPRPASTNTVDSSGNLMFSYIFYPGRGTRTTNFNFAGTSPGSDEALTREQIAAATLTYGYSSSGLATLGQDSSSNVCPISLEQFQAGDVVCEIRGCRHKFKRPNLMHWLRRSTRCPVCRYDLRNYMEEEPEQNEGQGQGQGSIDSADPSGNTDESQEQLIDTSEQDQSFTQESSSTEEPAQQTSFTEEPTEEPTEDTVSSVLGEILQEMINTQLQSGVGQSSQHTSLFSQSSPIMENFINSFRSNDGITRFEFEIEPIRIDVSNAMHTLNNLGNINRFFR